MIDREPPNLRESKRCAVCIHSEHGWMFICKKHDFLTAWNNVCDDYEAEVSDG